MTCLATTVSPSTLPVASRLARAGHWKLGAGQAVSLCSPQANVLSIAQGRFWVTADGPHSGPLNDHGDFFLEAGERLMVRAGQRIVIEPWGTDRGEPGFFGWDPQSALSSQTATRVVSWELSVARPMRDLGVAMALAFSALARLPWGLASVARRFGFRLGFQSRYYENSSKLCPVDGDCRSI